ncbi:MAG: AAA family ATPase [Acidobacteria bacterium RIFCSPLOWO2_12_FULL_54_10]|nr:MAG: AAA family ATPase [Acidobacteria bacterium RIFCSPLOWO2_12_FULL_54_10]
MATAKSIVLDPTRKSTITRELETSLKSRIVSQDEGVQAVLSAFQVFQAGLTLPNHPVGTLLFLGPTGSGKTRIVEAFAESLFGDANALIRVDCGEFQHSHEIAKLIGSPPGYLGHRETHPVLTQEALDYWHREDLKLSLLLFDEIEKASDALWQLLLGILDRATLTLGDNRRVDFSRTLIMMTSNLGAAEVNNKLYGTMGFGTTKSSSLLLDDNKLKKIPIEAARRKFSPEFMNRIDKVISFLPLNATDLEKILEIELTRIQSRLLQASGGNPVEILCSVQAKKFLLHDGLDVRYGARHLRRSLERHLVEPIAHLLASQQVGAGDLLQVDFFPAIQGLVFAKTARSGRLFSWNPGKKASYPMPDRNSPQSAKPAQATGA